MEKVESSPVSVIPQDRRKDVVSIYMISELQEAGKVSISSRRIRNKIQVVITVGDKDFTREFYSDKDMGDCIYYTLKDAYEEFF